MEENGGFYTLKGYQLHEDPSLTYAMEDYLEMICRMTMKDGTSNVRVSDISERLHVKPSSVTKMIQQLSTAGYIDSEKYGLISVTEKGRTAGKYLLYRHGVIFDFLCALNRSDDELEQVEKIEHYLDRRTVENMDSLTKLIKEGGAKLQ